MAGQRVLGFPLPVLELAAPRFLVVVELGELVDRGVVGGRRVLQQLLSADSGDGLVVAEAGKRSFAPAVLVRGHRAALHRDLEDGRPIPGGGDVGLERLDLLDDLAVPGLGLGVASGGRVGRRLGCRHPGLGVVERIGARAGSAPSPTAANAVRAMPAARPLSRRSLRTSDHPNNISHSRPARRPQALAPREGAEVRRARSRGSTGAVGRGVVGRGIFRRNRRRLEVVAPPPAPELLLRR